MNQAVGVISEIKSSFANLGENEERDMMVSVPLTPGIIAELGKQ